VVTSRFLIFTRRSCSSPGAGPAEDSEVLPLHQTSI